MQCSKHEPGLCLQCHVVSETTTKPWLRAQFQMWVQPWGGGVLKARVGCFTFFNGAPRVVGANGRLAEAHGARWEGYEGRDCWD